MMRPTTRTTTRTAAVGLAAVLLAQTGCSAGDSASTADQGNAAAEADRGGVYQDYGTNPQVDTSEDNRSTFALDVDTGSYAVARDYLREGFLPDAAAVRTEEFVNYFDQDYRPPEHGMGIHLDGAAVPFLDDPSKRVLRVGLQAAVVDDAERQPANLTFIVDVSGSMEGHNMEMVRSGLDRLLGSLRPDDAVAIASFDTGARLVQEMTPMTRQQAVRDAVARLAPGGSTNLEGGLRIGYEHAEANAREDGLNRVILLSDGAANVGQEDPQVLADQIAQASQTTTLAVIGVGRGTYDEVVLEQFADRGNGFYAYIDTIREAERLFVHDLTGTLQVMARDAKVQVSFNPAAVSRFRLLGYENRQLDHDEFRDDSVDGGEIGAGHNVTALYEVTLPEDGPGGADAELATVELRWDDPDSGEPVERAATLTAGDLAGSFEAAPDRLRQSILVAAFAESLRQAPWSQRVSLGQVADNAAVLRRALPDDDRVAEFAELASTAADLTG